MRHVAFPHAFLHRGPLAAAMLLAVLLLSGCPYGSDQPLSDSSEATVDPALLGSWHAQDPETGEVSQISFSVFDAHELILSAPGATEGSVEESHAFVTPVGNELFLNVHEVTADSAIWFLVRYRIEEDRLVLSIVDDGLFSGMHFATPAELHAFILQNLADPLLYAAGGEERQDMTWQRASP